MSYFRNVQDDGNWKRGGIYTFEVDSNEIETEEYPSMPSGTYEWDGTWRNWWFDHGAWNGTGYDPPYSYGYDIELIQRGKYCHYNDEGDWVCEGENTSTQEAGRNWTGSQHWGQTYVGGCSSDTMYNRIFALFTDTDSLTGECADEPAPIQGGRFLFDNNNENLEGVVDGITISETEVLEGGWIKYTVQVNEDLPDGIYYFKGKTFIYPIGGGAPG